MLTIFKLRKLIKEIKVATNEANMRGDHFRVDSLKYSRRKIKARIREFQIANKF